MQKTHFINGQWVHGLDEPFHSVNPANGQIIWEGNGANTKQVEEAVSAAHHAFKQWGSSTLDARLNVLDNYKIQLERNKDALALAISEEVGKPFWESLTEVGAMINKIAISHQAYLERTGIVEAKLAVGNAKTIHRPHGVVAVYGPYNFPGHLPNGHIVPALLAGNTIVFKPSELTPRVAELMMKCWHDSGIPAGVINMIQGGKSTGIDLSNADINGLFFTGSYATGQHLHKQFAGRPEIILALELGGNNPLIISEIENIDAAVYMTISSAFITSGQRCTCARRLILPNFKNRAQFIDRLIDVSNKLLIDQYDANPKPFMGPVISAAAAKNLISKQQQLLDAGGVSLLKMRSLQDNTGFVSPGIIDVSACQNIEDAELFGPLLQVHQVESFAEAITTANHTQYGLSAGLISDNLSLWEQFSSSIRAGIVNWNHQLTGASSSAPFGGIGRSGNHRPSAYYAADYCAYPVAGLQTASIELPKSLVPGVMIG